MDDLETEHATPNTLGSTPDTRRSTPETLHPTANTPPRPKLLIVDDEDNVRTQMKWAFNENYEVLLAHDRKTAVELFNRERPGLVTLDLGLPPDPSGVKEGFGVLSEILNRNALTKVILVTGQTAKEHALKGIGQGAYDFVSKPIDVDELDVILRRASYVHQLEQEHRLLQRKVESGPFEGMLGTSPQMQEVFARIRKVATTNVSVLILGESGTGKELAGQAIHQQSVRRDGPFIAINCSAIPETLLESELFGHEKGAFTGAHIQRKGRIETARAGTLFLDEVGEISPHVQVKLLRFLQEHVIERLGGRETVSVDVRVIVATNRDLAEDIAKGKFREDLYYRLGVVTITLPPLRERREDILLLAKAFLYRFVKETGKNVKGFNQKSLDALLAYTWPGNVRELENRIKRAVIMAEGQIVTPADLDLASGDGRHEGVGIKEAREALEKELILKALTRHRNNLTQAAVDLGISRPTLYDLMSKLRIEKEKS